MGTDEYNIPTHFYTTIRIYCILSDTEIYAKTAGLRPERNHHSIQFISSCDLHLRCLRGKCRRVNIKVAFILTSCVLSYSDPEVGNLPKFTVPLWFSKSTDNHSVCEKIK